MRAERQPLYWRRFVVVHRVAVIQPTGRISWKQLIGLSAGIAWLRRTNVV
jgi:hypothetical protein